MPNPWLIVGVLLAIAVAALGGYRHGIEHERGEAAKNYQRAITHAFEEWNREADEETARRLTLAAQQERAASAAREAKLRGQQHAAQNDRPVCRWPERRRVLINAAIDAANSAGNAPAVGLHAPVPGAAAAGK